MLEGKRNTKNLPSTSFIKCPEHVRCTNSEMNTKLPKSYISENGLKRLRSVLWNFGWGLYLPNIPKIPESISQTSHFYPKLKTRKCRLNNKISCRHSKNRVYSPPALIHSIIIEALVSWALVIGNCDLE